MVISTALFNKPAFKNLVVNGLVLAADGKKMSKRAKNYDDPVDVVRSFGADALRLRLIDSPVVRAEPLRFVTLGVRDVVKNVFIPWQNTYRYFVESAHRYTSREGRPFRVQPALRDRPKSNLMDAWIVASPHASAARRRALGSR